LASGISSINLLLVLLTGPFTPPDDPLQRIADEAVHRIVPGLTSVAPEVIDSVGAVLVGRKGDSVACYAVVRDVRGKDQPITFLLVLEPSLAITGLEILAYREPYGGEIRNSTWRRQFTGRQPGDPLRHGREIRNISGATISARSVTDGVRKILDAVRAGREALPALRPGGPE